MKISIIKAGIVMIMLALILGPVNILAAEEKPPAPGEGTTLAPGEGTTVAAADQEDEERPTVSADVAFLSQYIWRGYELSKDSLVIQPSVTAAYKGFSLNLWGNLDTNVYTGPYKGGSKWNETDFTFGYDTSFGPVGLGVGYIYYAMDSAKDTQEFYFSIGGDILLAPTLTVYRDVDELHGWYFDLGISHSFALPYEISLDVAGSIGFEYSDSNDIVDYDNHLNPTNSKFRNFQNGLVSVGLTVPFWKYFTAVPMIAYSFPLGNAADNMLKATSLSNDASHFFGGVTLSMAF